MGKKIYPYTYVDENGNEQTMRKRFHCFQLSRKYSEKYEGVDKVEEEEAYRNIAKTDPKQMHALVKGTKYEKYYLEVGPDTNIPCCGVNYEGNTSLKKYFINLVQV